MKISSIISVIVFLTTKVQASPVIASKPSLLERHQADHPLFGPQGVNPYDVELKDGPGDWIGAAVFAMAMLTGDNPIKKRVEQNGQDARISLIDTSGKDQTFMIKEKNTKSLLFDAHPYWWPNAIISAMLEMGTYDGISNGKLAPGNSANVFSMFGMSPAASRSFTTGEDDEKLKLINHDPAKGPVVIFTNNEINKKLKPIHAYAVAGVTGIVIGLQDPCGEGVTYNFDDFKDQIASISYVGDP